VSETERTVTGSCLSLWTPKDVRRHVDKLRRGTSRRRVGSKSRHEERLERRAAEQRAEAAADLLRPATTSAPSVAARGGGRPAASQTLLTVAGTNAREAWVAWLQPRFMASEGTTSAYFTGTYGDDYGFRYGLTLPRNVHRDFRRFLDELQIPTDFICGVERHRFRDVLHLHGIIQGNFTAEHLAHLKGMWAATRGHARVLPVLDGCASYVTKYALKGDTESFDWRLS